MRVGRSRIQGKGVFAKRKIPMGTRIIEYKGVRVALADLFVEVGHGMTSPIYLFRLNETMVIDGSRRGNEARFINHSCAPNCEAYLFADRMYLYAMRDIARGEELSFDYQLSSARSGKKAKRGADDPACLCGADSCRGTMRLIKRTKKIVQTRPGSSGAETAISGKTT